MIVAVVGGKGGVGKSTTAWNLGRELDAVVVDGDLAVPDLPAGTDADPVLHDVLAGRADPLEAVADDGPVSVLPSGRTLSGARASSLEALPSVLDRLERRWDRVVVDCPAGLARDVGVELRCGDLAVLVTRPSRTALVDAIRTRELAATLETPIAAAVLNRADRDAHGDLADRLERRLGVDVTTVAEQAAVADAQARWRPVRDHRPDAQAVDAYRTVADRLERARRRRRER